VHLLGPKKRALSRLLHFQGPLTKEGYEETKIILSHSRLFKFDVLSTIFNALHLGVLKLFKSMNTLEVFLGLCTFLTVMRKIMFFW
jgi:hypothetical protein